MRFKKGDRVRRVEDPVRFNGMRIGDLDVVLNSFDSGIIDLQKFGKGHSAKYFVLESIMNCYKTPQNMSELSLSATYGTTTDSIQYQGYDSQWNKWTTGTFTPLQDKPKKTVMKKLNNFLKKLVDADTQELLKAGLLNGDLELTCQGIYELQAIMFFANKDAMVARAKEINVEAATEEAKNK